MARGGLTGGLTCDGRRGPQRVPGRGGRLGRREGGRPYVNALAGPLVFARPHERPERGSPKPCFPPLSDRADVDTDRVDLVTESHISQCHREPARVERFPETGHQGVEPHLYRATAHGVRMGRDAIIAWWKRSSILSG